MKRSFSNIAVVFAVVTLAAMLLGCSKRKNSFFHRAYHNTTARYNGYFNSKESIKAGLKELNTTHQEDYTKILPVFIDGDKEELTSIQPYMNKVVEKSSNVIDRHSIDIKDIEYCRWIDENYYLIGQAHFYKQEFNDALTNLEYVSRRYDKSSTRHYAKLWAARTLIEQEEYDKAQEYLDELKRSIQDELYPEKEGKENKSEEAKEKSSKSKKKKYKKRKSSKKKRKTKKRKSSSKEAKIKDEKFPKRIEGEAAMVQADLYLRQEKYTKAIDELELAIAKTKKRKTKTRLYFILAQLYQKERNPSKASYYYSKTIKNRPVYEMEFYARINRALNFQESSGKKNPIKQELLKMLRDDKNIEYRDQIYFALADIAFKEGNEEKAIAYLVASTRYSISNNRQKGLSFLRLANTYFSKKDYELAKNYYDSTVVFLPKDHKSFEDISDRTSYLTDLVKNLNTIQYEDSLQMVASLTPQERDAFIEKLIFEKEDAERKKQEEESNNNALNTPTPKNTPSNSGSGNNWYFYNSKARSIGFTEFRKKWGNRKLEDNWRRKDKTTVQSSFDNNNDDQISSVQSNSNGNNASGNNTAAGNNKTEKKEEYLKDLPLTNEQKQASNRKILEAYYNAGVIYRENLRDENQARISFEKLVNRFDSSEYHLPIYYHLYRIYLNKNNLPKANEYKELISKYPNSEYWQIIINPNYMKDKEAGKLKDEANYTEVYEIYRNKNFEEAIACANYYLTEDSTNYFQPEFKFVKALSYASLNQQDSLKVILQELVANFSHHKVGQQAKDLLQMLESQQGNAFNDTIDSISINFNSTGNKNEKFSYKEDEEHFFVLVCPDSLGDINNLKAVLSDFNNNYFLNKNLQVESNYINNSDQAVLIKKLGNGEEALNYFTTYKNEQKLLKDLKNRYEYFVISKNNFTTLFQEKNLEEYLIFFQEKYFN